MHGQADLKGPYDNKKGRLRDNGVHLRKPGAFRECSRRGKAHGDNSKDRETRRHCSDTEFRRWTHAGTYI